METKAVPFDLSVPEQVLVNTNIVHKGLCLLPFDNLQIVSIHVDYVEVRNYKLTLELLLRAEIVKIIVFTKAHLDSIDRVIWGYNNGFLRKLMEDKGRLIDLVLWENE